MQATLCLNVKYVPDQRTVTSSWPSLVKETLECTLCSSPVHLMVNTWKFLYLCTATCRLTEEDGRFVSTHDLLYRSIFLLSCVHYTGSNCIESCMRDYGSICVLHLCRWQRKTQMCSCFYRAMHVVLARYCYRMFTVRPSVRPYVTLMYAEHIGWTSSKLITRIISLGSSLVGATTSAT